VVSVEGRRGNMRKKTHLGKPRSRWDDLQEIG